MGHTKFSMTSNFLKITRHTKFSLFNRNILDYFYITCSMIKFNSRICAKVAVKIGRLETATKFGHVIESFNINTNNWVAVYIYKRLKFMGNRTVSQVVTLLFLAVWHGFHSGYYLVFFNEFLSIKVEREFLSIWSKRAKVE